jgi:cell division protein FtsQ
MMAGSPICRSSSAPTPTGEYLALREQAGALAPRIRAATLVANRRWTLKLDNGLDVRLPESQPAAALKRLAALETESRLLEKEVLAIDLRQPDRVVMRLTEEGAAARAEALKAKTKKKGGEV